MIEHLFIDEGGSPPTKRLAVARLLIITFILLFPMGVAINESTLTRSSVSGCDRRR